ncbi:TetR/AcrR family transcriptional regulator [Mycobacterium sp. CBMA247]|nr:TetR/AcrR family transcriptional regulator [Mycolicibacterium sp. CBMA 329]MUL87959.1 TetR/AcrR family transcriptional regulator [Mycolicibacterium sp. CBMA 331]MUM02290.1 TetR/AcrR family transcriptional regulator [Mycolicibacterium sp. CBMA 334]MUM26426.1 TetR/AcrR family transcriptional regulator [Mycolicibacterium sp. CBMA 295]MUM38256.1 TetR/AcrR family transcriptional regulator [Mycolicibacterium sp. CBMA 247]MUM44024.1 TetR/AcrR family transcriptional regulator [Mycolicibacterium sp.
MRGQGALLRDEIVAAATRVIDAAQNEGDVSLRSIAREAGIAAPSVYAHFEDRDSVLDAVAEASWTQVSEEITQLRSSSRPPRERLLLGCQTYVSFAERHPLRYSLMTQITDTSPAAKQALAVVTRGLLACRGGDPQAPPTPESDRIAAALSVAVHGVAMLHRTDTPHLWLSSFSTDEIIRSLVDAAILQQDQAAAESPGRRQPTSGRGRKDRQLGS